MNKKSILAIVLLMSENVETTNELLLETRKELSIAKDRKNKKVFAEFMDDLKILEKIIKIAQFIKDDIQCENVSYGSELLLELTADNVEKMLHDVVTRKRLQKRIVNNFQEANILMKSEF